MTTSPRRRAANRSESPVSPPSAEATSTPEPIETDQADSVDSETTRLPGDDQPDAITFEAPALIEPATPQPSATHDVTVLRETLLGALQLVGRAAAPKLGIPILGGARVEADAESQTLRLACTNLEIGILQRIDAHVRHSWRLVIPVKIWTDTIAAMPHEKVRLRYDPDTLSVTIEGMGDAVTDGIASHCVIYGMDADDFPTIDDGSAMESMLILNGETVRRMVRKLGFIVGDVDRHPVHASVHLVSNETTLVCQATDGFRLSQLTIPIPEGNGTSFDLMLPKPTLRELGRIVGDSGHVTMRGKDNGNQIWFTHNDTTVISRVIDGTYPNVERVIPSTFQIEARPRLSWLTSLVRQARIFAENSVVEMTFNLEHLTMRAVTRQAGAASVSMPCRATGDPIVVHLNIEYVRDACEAIELDDISIQVASPTSPVVLREHASDNFMHVIMPMSPPTSK